MFKRFSHYLFLFFFLFLSSATIAQYPLLRHYSTKEGLPSATIYVMVQDKDGFIWISTDVGVTRYDGKSFHNYTLADGLSDNYILAVKTDSKDRKWFLGYNGTVSYWLNGKIYNAESDTLLRNITSTNSFLDVFEDNENRLWFISLFENIILDKNKIIRVDSKVLNGSGIILNGKSCPIILTPNAPFFSKYVSETLYPLQLNYKLKRRRGHLKSADGSIFFQANEGIVWQKDTMQKLLIPFSGEFNNLNISSMTMSTDSVLWISAMGQGIYGFNLKTPEVKPVIYLKNKLTSSVLADREGNIWISTVDEGLYMIPVWGKKVAIINRENGLSDNLCYALSKRIDGELLIGQKKGKIQSVSNEKLFDVKMPEYDSVYNIVHRIISRGDDVWIAMDGGLVHQNLKTGCNHFVNCRDLPNSIKKMSGVKNIALGENQIYFDNGFAIMEYPAKCPADSIYLADNLNVKFNRIYSIYCDYSNRIWYGTIVGLQSKKDTIFSDHSEENYLLAGRINSIAETEDSVLVLGTHGHGILFYKNGKILKRVTIADGLCDDICRRLVVHKNCIYACTPSGVSVLFYSNGKVQKIQNINTGNFLPSNDVNDVFADDMDISVATMEGVAIIAQSDLNSIEPFVPLLYITGVRVNGDINLPESKRILRYDENSFRFNFIGIYFQKPDEVNYRYRLKSDQAWQSTENTTLEFSFLTSGTYNFQLQARILTGEWSPVRSFLFTISPPFWGTWWFRLSTIIIFLSIVYFAVKRRLKNVRERIEEKAKIEKQITELEQQALQTMMDPHFIFNVMNSIQHFINANDKEAANHYLTDFAKLIRMNLTISYKRFIPLEEEISYLELYLSFEKLRFGDKLTYEIVVDPAIDVSETTIAVMMIQPFIENAVWHGILPMKEVGHIIIQIHKMADKLLKITIEDNGIGINEKFILNDYQMLIKESHALSMTLQRLKLFAKLSPHELYIRFRHVHPKQEYKGTIVEMLLPAMFY